MSTGAARALALAGALAGAAIVLVILGVHPGIAFALFVAAVAVYGYAAMRQSDERGRRDDER
jgi:hypothetical protein